MSRLRVQFQSGVVTDETRHAARPRWVNSDKVRFWRGLPETRGGSSIASVDSFDGYCRGLFTWASNNGTAYGAVGTNTKLYILYGGLLYDVTPIRASDTMSADPVATTSGSSTVTITDSAHGASTGDTVYISGLTATAGVTVGGGTGTFAASPFSVTSGSSFVVATLASHGLSTGDIVVVASSSAVGGITPDGTWTIRVFDANTFGFQFTAAATSTAVGGGTPTYENFHGYVLTVVTANTYTVVGSGTASSTTTGGGASGKVKYEISVGNADGTGGGGYGTGGYGEGGYGVGGSTSTTTYPRTWSLDNWGEYLAANPRGGTIYEWQLNLSTRAAAISNAPSAVTYMLVTAERIMMALGCHDGSAFKPMLVRWSGQENNTVWTAAQTNLAGDFPLSGGSRLVAGKKSTGQILLWSDTTLFSARFNADPNAVYTFDTLGDGGLIGPNAFAEQDGRAFWVDDSAHFMIYEGGAPRPIDCPCVIYFRERLAPAQNEKMYAMVTDQAQIITIYYASNAGLECDSYIEWSTQDGSWMIGSFARTAGIDRSVLGDALVANADGTLSFDNVGQSLNGEPLMATITSSPIELDPAGGRLMDIFKFIPDFKNLVVGVNMTVYTRQEAQGAITTFGPYLIEPGTIQTDCRINGREAWFEFSSVAASNARWRLGDMVIDMQPAGER